MYLHISVSSLSTAIWQRTSKYRSWDNNVFFQGSMGWWGSAENSHLGILMGTAGSWAGLVRSPVSPALSAVGASMAEMAGDQPSISVQGPSTWRAWAASQHAGFRGIRLLPGDSWLKWWEARANSFFTPDLQTASLALYSVGQRSH